MISPEGNPIGINDQDEAMDEEAVVEEAEAAAQDTPFGEILVNSQGIALYLFTMDEQNLSNCLGDCLNL
jgi:predicted lipoprotein with Yx(FWY)xxD motif